MKAQKDRRHVSQTEWSNKKDYVDLQNKFVQNFKRKIKRKTLINKDDEKKMKKMKKMKVKIIPKSMLY